MSYWVYLNSVVAIVVILVWVLVGVVLIVEKEEEEEEEEEEDEEEEEEEDEEEEEEINKEDDEEHNDINRQGAAWKHMKNIDLKCPAAGSAKSCSAHDDYVDSMPMILARTSGNAFSA